MLRATLDRRLICAAFFPFTSSPKETSNHETTGISQYRITVDKMKDIVLDENGNPSKELQSVINATLAGITAGFFLGAIRKINATMERTKRENQATLYANRYEASQQVQIKMGRACITGGIPMAAKLGTFCFMFWGISTGLHMYRGKYDMLNLICAGGVTGCLFKLNMGLRGMLSGTFLGTLLGVISSLITTFVLFVSGTDINEVYKLNYNIADARREQLKKHSRARVMQEQEELRKNLLAKMDE